MTQQQYNGPLERLNDNCWRIPKDYRKGMRVDGVVYADDHLIDDILHDQSLEQVANVAHLPGIQQASLAMPDIHWGYGFPIGGVCATDPHEGGVISPGGVGYDINCGVRLMRSNLFFQDVQPKLTAVMDQLFANIPAGTGRGGKYVFHGKDMKRLLGRGVSFLRERNLATDEDVAHTEANGCLPNAVPDYVSQRAIQRGANQCGTLGSGNHFLEVQIVESIYDREAACAMGLEQGQVCVMIHSGSRGLGYQVCDDALKRLRGAPARYGIDLPDRQLACAPIDSTEGEKYLGAMCAAANFAWCNRLLLMWQARESFQNVFGQNWERLQMDLVYDVAHNIAKLETHRIGGVEKQVWVHRKGATRAFPAHHPEVPEVFRQIGQPVLIPGDMGRASWVLAGRPGSMDLTFGTCCHGAGRKMSRKAAVNHARGRDLYRELSELGVIARARSWRGLAEEQPDAYKDVDLVVNVVHNAGLASRVAKMRPIGVVKG